MQSAINSDYLPSTKYVINHDIMNCTAEGVIGNHLFSARGLGISEPNDIIQLHPDLEPLWDDISIHYKRIGLSHSENVIWDLDLAHLGSHIGHQPSVFFFGHNENHNWGDHEWMNAVNFINSKNNFIRLAQELDINIPDTLCFDRADSVRDDDIEDINYPCYLKAAISVSGVGIYRCENKTDLLQSLIMFDRDTPIQIQAEVKCDKFLNLQYQVIDDQLIQLTSSEQILKGFEHQGNRVPSSHEPWQTVEPMAYWLKDKGIKGIFAFDVAVSQTDHGLQFPAIECNPRFNGASYPTLIANKLDISEWSTLNLDTRHKKLSDIYLQDIEYDTKTNEGVIIVNWGSILAGKISVLFAGSEAHQNALLDEFKTRL